MLTDQARIGYHYYPDDKHFTQRDLNTWLPVLDSLRAHWLVLRASPERAVPESFLRGMIESGIEPIVHIPGRVGVLRSQDLSPLLSCYAKWGVRYVAVFERPNLRAHWETADWSRRDLVERFVDLMVPILTMQLQAGLSPVLPPLEPGGDYWDTAFLEGTLRSLGRRGQNAILKELNLAVYATTFGKPLEWGMGGPERWPEATPYHTPPGCQDQIGFRTFEWYAAISKELLGRVTPMLVLQGGSTGGSDPNLPRQEVQAEKTMTIVRALESGEIPPYVLEFAFYPLVAQPGTEAWQESWFPSLDEPKVVVKALRRHFDSVTKSPPEPSRKVLAHYMLLPERVEAMTSQAWESIHALALKERAVIGFSARQAALAKQVTIIGDVDAVPSLTEEALRARGCLVRRLAPSLSWQGAIEPVCDIKAVPENPNHDAGVPHG